MSEAKAQPNNVRQGLALICIGVIAVVLGFVGMRGPSLVEAAGSALWAGGFLVGLLGLALVAWGLLRD